MCDFRARDVTTEIDAMEQFRQRIGVDPALDTSRAVLAGILAAFGYLGCMYADMALTGSRSDDLLMIGRPLSADPRRARSLGLTAHLSFGAIVGVVYAAYGRTRLSGPNWKRGIKTMLVENTILWPLTFVADRLHPSMRDGTLPRLNTPVPFAQQWARHVVFGYLLGAVYGNGKPAAEG